VAERVVVLSSADVYRAYGRLMRQEPGRLEPVPLAETAPLRRSFFVYRRMAGDPAEPLFHYEKLLVETALAREPSLANTIIRPASVYGPGDPDRQLFALVKRMMDERPAILVGERAAAWRWSWVYVDNLAAAVALAVASPEAVGGVYNVADEPTPTQHEWIEAVAAAAAWPGDVRVLPDAGLPRHLLPPVDVRQDLVLDTGRIRRELGFQESVKREKALAETVEWTRAHPPDRFDPRRFDYAAEDQVLSRLGGAVE
jgi:nucleoside-diphosphate-sugar epimerase